MQFLQQEGIEALVEKYNTVTVTLFEAMGKIADEIETQTEQTLINLGSILKATGFDYSHVVKTLGEVFVGSFFLQTFGLITPLFSQVIIDKVLIHKGLSTLDVLVLGLFVINIFEMILSVTRTYLFSHTTNRVDVILGAKLFKHLLALPLPYFEARTVGTTIARVRELETIRSFITGTALTVVLDLIFTVVFVAVMFFYSPKLTLISLAALPFFVALSVVVTLIIRERLNKKFACNAESFLNAPAY